jgi:uncharacterized membrane protein HdeD (DUF308 family)
MSSPSSPLVSIANKSLNWSIALSFLLIIAGLFAILIPPVFGLGVTLFIGWLLILSGITHLVFTWKAHSTSARIWELLVGLVYTFAGGFLILHPMTGLISLTLVLAYYLAVEALLELTLAFHLRPLTGWVWLLVDAVVTLILAIMIWKTWPASTVWVIGTLVGLSMLFSGISRLMLSLATRRLLNSFE